MLDCSEGQQEGVPPFSPAHALLNQASQVHPSAWRQTDRERRGEKEGVWGGLRRWRCKPDWWRQLRRERLWQMWWLQTQRPEYHRASWELFWRENHVSKNYKEKHWSHIHTRQLRQGGRGGVGRGGGGGGGQVGGVTEAFQPHLLPFVSLQKSKYERRRGDFDEGDEGRKVTGPIPPPHHPTSPRAFLGGFSRAWTRCQVRTSQKPSFKRA